VQTISNADEHVKKPMMIPDVLCPWGCSEFAFKAKPLQPSTMFQHLLPKVQLNLPNDRASFMHLSETARLDYIQKPDEERDYVLMNKSWPVMPSVLMVRGKGLMICTCRYHSMPCTQKRLYHHPPRKLNSMNLSLVYTDQLSHAVIQPCIVHPVKKKGMNTVPSLSLFKNSYMGADSTDVTIGGRFKNICCRCMNYIHQVHSLE